MTAMGMSTLLPSTKLHHKTGTVCAAGQLTGVLDEE
jgi:hypothetical protein